jgi:hypothetical protein
VGVNRPESAARRALAIFIRRAAGEFDHAT